MADQIISIPGLGDVAFPEGMSNSDIEKAIEEHLKSPGKFAKSEMANVVPTNILPQDRITEALPDFAKPIYEHLKDPGWVGVMAKGIPVAGKYVSDTPAIRSIEENYPKTATGLKIAGGIGSMIAPAGGMSKAASLIGPGRIIEGIAQGGLGATTNVADKLAETGLSSDIQNDAILGFLGGASGPAIGKVISPIKDIKRVAAKAPEQLQHYSEKELEKIFSKKAASAARQESLSKVKQAAAKLIENPMLTAIGSGAIAQLSGHSSPLAIAALGALAPAGIKGAGYAATNTLMSTLR